MEGDLHGLALLLMVITAAVLCYRYGRAPQLVLPTFVFWLVGGYLAMLVLNHLVFSLVHVVWNDLPSAVQIAITFSTHQAVILLVCLALVWRMLTLSHIQKLLLIGCILLIGGLSLLHMQRVTLRWGYDCDPPAMALIRESPRSFPRYARVYWHTGITGLKEDGKWIRVIDVFPIAGAMKPLTLPAEIGEDIRDNISAGSLKAWVDQRYDEGTAAFVMVIGVMLTILLLIRYARWDDLTYPLRKRFAFGVCLGATLLTFGTNLEVIPLIVMASCLAILGWWLPNRAPLQLTVIVLFILPTIALSWLSTV